MSITSDRARFIPFRKKDIITMIISDNSFKNESDRKSFSQLCEMMESIFHFEFYKELKTLKDVYFPINPDLESHHKSSEEEINNANDQLLITLQKVLNDANYDKISKKEIEKAYENSALVGISVNIDLTDYDFVEIYTRGRRTDKFTVKKLFGLKKTEIEHVILERVLLVARLKNTEDDSLISSDSTIIKLFKDVPLEDLEILFPNSKVVMSLKDKLMIAVPAIAAGVPLLVTKVIPALIVAFIIISAYFGVKGSIEENQLKQTIAVLSALGALAGFIFKQISKYKSKKFHFQKELSDNLYFRNLVNNAGVFYSLIDSAEEEEFKEAILAYYFLYKTKSKLNEDTLDKEIELWLEDKYECDIDFECSDALAKLKRLKLLETDADNYLKIIDLTESLKRLDYRWDNYFKYN